jgi:hypothetical protein
MEEKENRERKDRQKKLMKKTLQMKVERADAEAGFGMLFCRNYMVWKR